MTLRDAHVLAVAEEAAVVLLREAEVETKVVEAAVSLGHSHHSRNHNLSHSRSHRTSQVVVHLVEAKEVVVAEVLLHLLVVEAKVVVVEEQLNLINLVSSRATATSHRPQQRSSTSFGSNAWPMIP